MPLPEWVGERATISYKVADTPWTAPGYRLVGKDSYTCVPPTDRTVDKAVLKAVHDFAPDLIPLWRKQQYIPPGGTQPFTVSHLCLGRYIKDPRNRLHIPYVEMPAGARHPMPNVLERVFEDKEDLTVLHHGGPGRDLPFDMAAVRELRATDSFADNRPQHVIDEENDRNRIEAEIKRLEFFVDQWEYRQKHIDKFVQKQLDAPGDTFRAWQEYRRRRFFQRLRTVRRGIEEKAFVHMQGA